MRARRLFQVDSFTRTRFEGNPAGVVLDADGLDDGTMQAIARELNNPETAFVFAPVSADHDVFIRYFTPVTEVPICGHATIAAHFVRATVLDLPSGTVRQRSGIGVLPIEIGNGDGYRVTMTQGRAELGAVLENGLVERTCAALRLDRRDLDSLPIQLVSTGSRKIMVPIRSGRRLDSLEPDLPAVSALTRDLHATGIFAFTFDTGRTDVLTSCRMFAPLIGIPEDPVTGNGNGPLGAYLLNHGIIGSGEFRSLQGKAMGRPGIVRVQVAGRPGAIEYVKVGDEAVIAFETTIAVQ